MSEALQRVIGEFKTLSPDITKTVVFRLDGETLAASEDATPEQTQALIAKLNGITQSECIGGIDNLTIQDVNSQLSVTNVGGVYLATVSSRTGDQKVVKSLTQVVAPTVIRLTSGTRPVEIEKPKILQEVIQPETVTEKDPEIEAPIETEVPPEPFLPTAPTSQFMTEKIGGFLVATDTVRIDSEVITNWQALCDGKQFTSVCIQTLEGKTATCKFKPQKDTKGIIGVPDKILQALECDKGKLVIVKPVIE